MQIVTWLENRISTRYTDEIFRRQLLTSFVPALSTTLFALSWAIIFFAAGLPALGYTLLGYTLITLVCVIVSIYRPQFGLLFVLIFGLAGLGANLAAHLIAGGFEAGIWFLLWVVVLPLTVYLAGARREGIIVLIASLLAIGVAIVLDSRLAAPLEIPDWIRLAYNAFVLYICVLMLFIWGVFILQQVDSARQRADGLLLNILPDAIATKLKRNPDIIADGYDEVTVLFADIVNFTTLSADADPVDVVAFLNTLFSDFDDLAQKHGLEKIKTIGDAYMVAGGLPTPRPDHCEAVVAFAIDMLAACKYRTAWHGQPVHLRVGVNTGPVVAGVIGRHKFIYDLWGDAVNTASRMESNGVQDVIQVTGAVRDRLAGKYAFEARPPIYIKGKGEMVTYLLQVT